MKNEQSLAIMKALGDQSRLAIVKSLLDQPQYVEEIAQRHNLAPSTVSFHLRKLEHAGLVSSRKEQYYVVFAPNEQLFDATLRQIVLAHPVGTAVQDDRMAAYRDKVVATFFRSGRLEKLPAQHKKRLIVLEEFARRFELRRRYSEQEVTELILPVFDDYCTIRRLLIDEGLIRREETAYWREKELSRVAAAMKPPTRTGVPESRSEAKRRYVESRPHGGVYQICNKINGRTYVGRCENLESTRTSRLFQLRMGKVPFSPELQKDLNQAGAEAFDFSVLATLDVTEQGGDVETSLAALHLHWLEKLQPFGERGYNSQRAFERELIKLRRQGQM